MIRPAKLADLGQIGQLIRESFKPELLPYMVYAQHGIGSFLAQFIRYRRILSDRMLLVTEGDAGILTAFAEFRYLDQGKSLLSYICVRPEARGHGLASALIRHHLQQMPGLWRVDLDVFADNGPALSLYRKLGFEEAGTATWFARPIPATGNGADPIGIPNLPVANAAYDRYGFCELQVSWGDNETRMGRIGNSVLRCFEAANFKNDALLARLAAAFPDLREVLLIDDADPEVGRPINRSIRMTGTFSGE